MPIDESLKFNSTAIDLLHAIRERRITVRDQLQKTGYRPVGSPGPCNDYGRDGGEFTYSDEHSKSILDELIALGLVTESDEGVAVTEKLSELQGALGISLTTLKWQADRELYRERIEELLQAERELESARWNCISGQPHFGIPKPNVHAAEIFMASPFGTPFDEIYADHVTSVARSLKLSILRADDLFRTTSVMNDIWRAIHNCKYVVADCTDRNPNVFYEIGIAHTIGRTVILVTQDLSHVPFDVRHLRCIVYEYTPRGMKDFESALRKTLENQGPEIGT